MSVASLQRPRTGVAPAALLNAPALAFALGAAIYLAMQAGAALEVWTQGLYVDTDDAMRMTQLRDFMAGKPWADFSVTRMSPPEGFRTHWSHVIDLPLAALVRLFGLALDPAMAERAARLAFPALCFFATLAVLIALARRMTGPLGGLVVALVAPAQVFANQFHAGRIDHHGPQLLLLAAVALTLVISLDPRRALAAARAGALSGALAALSLAISVENLPFLAVAAALYAVAAALDPRHGSAAAAFGASLALCTALAWAIFADAAAAAGPVCDALSTFHVALAALGGLGLAAHSAVAPRLPSSARWAGLAALAAAVLALAKIGFPHCLADPLAALPPIVVDYWLSHVTEAEPWLAATRHQPVVAAAIAGPILFALPAMALAGRAGMSGEDVEPAVARARWAAMIALVLVGALATLWQVRAGGSTQIPALVAAAAAGVYAARFATRGGLSLLAPMAMTLPFVSLVWVILTPDPAASAPVGASPPASAATGLAAPVDCLSPAATAGLAALPPALVLTSLDPGSYLLAQTPHAALAGAYHRNTRGNADALEALLGAPDAARAVVARRKIGLVAYCPGLADFALYVRERPASLAAALAADRTPDWLERLPDAGPWRVYRPR
jgi:hypothetical protein